MDENTFRKDDIFLYGNHVIAQKDAKKVGDQITYYKVLKAENNGKDIEYIQIFDVLEEDVIDDKRD
jgi:hypothetical protein